jgi:hypothetical protein
LAGDDSPNSQADAYNQHMMSHPQKLPLLTATTALLSIAFACTFNLLSVASVKKMHEVVPDGYLNDQFQWTITLDLPDANQYLKYPKSKLWPLTRVRADFKSNVAKDPTSAKTYYEELWYHDDVVIGLRRHNAITLPPNTQGAVVVCPGSDDADISKRAAAIADAITRLTIDVQLRDASLGVVLVPESEFKTISAALAANRFRAGDDSSSFSPLSVHLLSYPGGEDTTLYL